MPEKDPATTSSETENSEAVAQPQSLLAITETTTAKQREKKTFTYTIEVGKIGMLFATSRREMRDMPTPTEADPGATAPVEMEIIGVIGGTEADGKRDYMHFSREFIPPFDSPAGREIVLHQLSTIAAGSMIVTSRENIEHALTHDLAADQQTPDQPNSTELPTLPQE